MFIWKPTYAFSKHLILCDPENIDWQKWDVLFKDLEDNYRVYKNEISRVMMNGLMSFHDDCKNYSQREEIVIKHEVYSKLLRWIITENNPRYLQPKFDDFIKAAKNLWVYLFGHNFHKFLIPQPNKSYFFDREVWKLWFEAIQRRKNE